MNSSPLPPKKNPGYAIARISSTGRVCNSDVLDISIIKKNWEGTNELYTRLQERQIVQLDKFWYASI